MKKIIIPSMVFVLFLTLSASAQDWVKMMNDPKANLNDVRAAFNKWYDAHKSAEADNKSDIKEGKDEMEEQGYALFKRWEYKMMRRANPDGSIPDMGEIKKQYSEYLKSHRSVRHAATTVSNWKYVGNTNVPLYSGDGRVNRLHFYPGNSNIIYATSPSGGLWKTTNGGTTWSTNTDQLSELGTGDMAINPLNPAIMYLGTGDNDAGGDFTPCTEGVLRSNDGGLTWNNTGMVYSLPYANSNYITVNQLIFNPADTGTLFAATSFGLFYTKDDGATWASSINDNMKDLEFEPFHSSTCYAASYTGHFYRSTDSGMTFTLITAGLPATGVERMAIGVSPADSNDVYVVAVDANNYGFYGLYKSTDRGQTFTTQALRSAGAPNLLGWSPAGSDSSGQAWYNLVITVSPTYADSVYVAGSLLWLSTDGGVTWNSNSPFYNNGHVDIHSVIFYPGSSSHMLLACDGGVYESPNTGAYWSDISNNLEIGEQYSVGPSADNPNFWITGWQDNGCNISYPYWQYTFGGDGMTCFIDYSNDNTLFASSEEGYFGSSFDGGSTWNYAANGITEQGLWNTPWMQDPEYPSILYSGFKNVWESDDQGNSWTPISTWGNYYINALAVSTVNDLYVYAAQYSSIYCTPDGSITWNNITGTLPTGSASISGIAIDPSTTNHVWVSFSGYSVGNKVYQSLDGGKTWVNVSAGLPNLSINCIAYQPGSPNGLYVGTDIGVYYMDTTTSGWVPFDNGLPNVEVDELQFSPGNLIDAATYGRGTWQSPTYVNTGVKNIVASNNLIKVYPNPASNMIKIDADNMGEGNVTVAITDITGRSLLQQSIDNNTAHFVKDLDISTLQTGVYFVTLKSNGTEITKKFIKE